MKKCEIRIISRYNRRLLSMGATRILRELKKHKMLLRTDS